MSSKTKTTSPRRKSKSVAAAKVRRVGTEQSDTRTTILDATEEVMVKDGYAAVTTRRVASQAGIKPALVQYYFRTMDDLFLAVYRRAAGAVIDSQAEALASEQPLHALWALNADPQRTRLAIEFMALANHRKIINAEISDYKERARSDQVTAIASVLKGKLTDPKRYSPAVVSVLLAAVARGLIMEEGMGIYSGHAETRELVAWWLKRLDPPARRARAKS